MRNNTSGPESKNNSPSDRTNTGLDFPQSAKTAVYVPATVEMENTVCNIPANNYFSLRGLFVRFLRGVAVLSFRWEEFFTTNVNRS